MAGLAASDEGKPEGSMGIDVADVRVPARYRRDFTVEAVEVVFRGVCEQCTTGTPRPGTS